ncbi:amino acid permease-domain-containing protein [Melanogaster broomeanus]|nr:amino acid permease-domain-containing protein [Melanogaster broomeanus]
METPTSIDTELIVIRPHTLEAAQTTTCELKFKAVPSRFLNLSNDFEFAGWGSIFRIELSQDDLSHGNNTLRDLRRKQVLGQFGASALAANDILGGVFYTIPTVFAISGVYSPLSMFIATLTLFLWRPIMEELGSALPISGAPYTYLLNGSTKSVALLGAALLLLDFAATAVVSATTATSYLAGEVDIQFPLYVVTVFVFVLFYRCHARVASGVLAIHLLTMVVLIVASITSWASVGSAQLRENWVTGQVGPASLAYILKQVFNGVCIGMLGLTGFECAPAYAAKMRPGTYPSVLRNLHIPAIILNTTMMFFVLALLPLKVQAEENVLSLLAQKVCGTVVKDMGGTDAVIVLCAGVLTGIMSACELLAELSHDRVLPRAFVACLPYTGAPGVIYASTGADITVVSKMCSFSSVISAVAVAAAVFAGNIAIDPTIAGWFALYFLALVIFFSIADNKVGILRWVYWSYDQVPLLHRLQLTRNWGGALITAMRRLRRQEVCLLVKTDEINQLFNMILYVRHNEETSCLKIVHFHDGIVPLEMDANVKSMSIYPYNGCRVTMSFEMVFTVLDEAFPEITIDLMLVDGPFNPQTVAALAHRLQIPTSLMFMSCPGPDFQCPVAEFGTRIISI